MTMLTDIDLRSDPEAAFYLKHEVVDVAFATEPGELVSREGPNRYQPSDALITSRTGDRWCVSRDRFDPKYEAIPPLAHGHDGAYRNKPIPVLAREMREAFSIERSAGGDVLHGKPGDWLMQYAPGDYGITERARFEQVYRPLQD
ncbi:MAG: hypothetical protein HOQ33_05505 [Cupriavidus sp.]|nr:hypothetical protein [Cupriavidus sp.]